MDADLRRRRRIVAVTFALSLALGGGIVEAAPTYDFKSITYGMRL